MDCLCVRRPSQNDGAIELIATMIRRRTLLVLLLREREPELGISKKAMNQALQS